MATSKIVGIQRIESSGIDRYKDGENILGS